MNALLDTGYQDYPQILNATYNMCFIDKEESLEEATEMMQQRYPGKYVLDHIYNHSRGAFELVLKFDNPKEEMLWKMKWA